MALARQSLSLQRYTPYFRRVDTDNKEYVVFTLVDIRYIKGYIVFLSMDTAYTKRYAVFPGVDTIYTMYYAVFSGLDTKGYWCVQSKKY